MPDDKLNIGAYIDDLERRANILMNTYPQVAVAAAVIPIARQAIANLYLALDKLDKALLSIERH